MSRTISERFLEYPDFQIIEPDATTLDLILNTYGGVIPAQYRYAGRSFCTPGRRLRLNEASLYPDQLVTSGGQQIGLDELWYFCNIPINTGAKVKATGKDPFCEGRATASTPDGKLALFQALTALNPELVLGKKIADRTRRELGEPTWDLVSKVFDNLNAIPHHMHVVKDEAHDPNRWLNPGVHQAHQVTTAAGLKSWVTREHLLEVFKKFDDPQAAYNKFRNLSDAMWVQIGMAYLMPHLRWHAPCNFATKELHGPFDEHGLGDNITLDGRIDKAGALAAIRRCDIPEHLIGNWEHFVYVVNDMIINQYPNADRDWTRAPLDEAKFSGDGWKSHWVIHGLLRGQQLFTSLRTCVEPGATATLGFETPSFFHLMEGHGKVGNYEVQHHPVLELNTLYNESGFVTEQARGSFTVKNLSSKNPLWLTFDFCKDAHSVAPGMLV